MQPQGFFVAQHDITRTSTGAIAIFDNGAGAPPKDGRASGRPSRGLILRQPKLPGLPVFVEHTLTADTPRRTYSQGSVQQLPNMDYMVGWGGDEPWFSEFSGDGQLIYDAHLVPESLDSYRVYRIPWGGHPRRPARHRGVVQRRHQQGLRELERGDGRRPLAGGRRLEPGRAAPGRVAG